MMHQWLYLAFIKAKRVRLVMVGQSWGYTGYITSYVEGEEWVQIEDKEDGAGPRLINLRFVQMLHFPDDEV